MIQPNLLKTEMDSILLLSAITSRGICIMDDAEPLLCECINAFAIGELARWQGKASVDTSKENKFYSAMNKTYCIFQTIVSCL